MSATPLEAATPLIVSPLGRQGLTNLAQVLKAVAHEHRLVILHELAHERNIAAGTFAEMLGLTQSQTSYHLQQLLDAGLIQRHRWKQWMVYSLVNGALDRLAYLLQGSAELDAARADMFHTLFPAGRRG